jgi:hypothetical protein
MQKVYEMVTDCQNGTWQTISIMAHEGQQPDPSEHQLKTWGMFMDKQGNWWYMDMFIDWTKEQAYRNLDDAGDDEHLEIDRERPWID